MKNIFAIIFILFSGCAWGTKWSTPFSSMMGMKIPDGTPAFRQGFQDGCGSAFYSRGNVIYRNKYKYKYDTKMITNAEYRFGHQRGYHSCFVHALSGVAGGPQASFDKSITPYGYDSTFNAGNINDAWGGFFQTGIWSDSLSNGGLNSVVDVFQKGIYGGTTFGSHPLWAGGSKGQFLGWD